ncbi:MAG: hypothetical protein DRJ66_01325 [Thermoprotei archaeon]|nr:MAG: hypothetical protein DRJ66_01325 [Thermoprotei archaeon]RLF19341.1 MAG: hypothetical protein DRZ82_06070 [Thermoprotei archaeon]
MSSEEYIVIEIPRGPGYRIKTALRRIAMVIYTPFELMSEIAREPELSGALLALLLCILIMTLSSTIFSSKVRIIYYNATSGETIGVIGGGIYKRRVLLALAMTSITTLMGWLMITIIIYLISSFLKGVTTLKAVASAIGYTATIKAVVEILRIFNIIMATKGGIVTVKVGLSPGMSMKEVMSIINSAISSYAGWPYALISNFLSYLLQIWMLALFIITAYGACGLSLKKAIPIGIVALIISTFIRWI